MESSTGGESRAPSPTAPVSNRAERVALAHQYLPAHVPSPSSTSSPRPSAVKSTDTAERSRINGSSTLAASPKDASPPIRIAPDLHHVPFGSRLLSNPEDVYSHNAWDHVVPPPEWEDDVRARLVFQREGMVEDEKRDAFNARPALYWDKFYRLNTNRFFKDRHWLRLEFGELMRCAEVGAGPKKVVEIGCGAGNTVFPLLAHNENAELEVWACDYSWKAVEVVKENELYPVPPHGKGRLHASVWDVTKPPVSSQSQRTSAMSSSSSITGGSGSALDLTDASTPPPTLAAGLPSSPATPEGTSLPEGVEAGTIDIAIMIFVMSALHPEEWKRAVANVWKMLKPNGLLFIRDYGRYDLAQLRIKRGRMLGENFYVRGDGTRVYFFEAAELSELLTGSKDAYVPTETSETAVEVDTSPSKPAYETDSVEVVQAAGIPSEDSQEGGRSMLDCAADTLGFDKLGILDPAAQGGDSSYVEERSGVRYRAGQALSTRFATATTSAAFHTAPTPRVDFQLHQTPVVEGAVPDVRDDPVNEGKGGASPAEAEFNPFAGSHLDLGIPDHPLFAIEQLGVDRRMLVNRKEQLKMYRIWMQVKARKLVGDTQHVSDGPVD